jgi:hypothetical protein
MKRRETRAFYRRRSQLSSVKGMTIPVYNDAAERHPPTQKTTFEMSGAKDKTIVWIEGADHGFGPSGPKSGDGKQQQRAAAAVLEWMDKRFPK